MVRSRTPNHVGTRAIRASTPRLANAHLWRSAAGASRGIVGCLAQAGDQPFRSQLRITGVHAPRDVILVRAAAIFSACKLRPPDRAFLRCDLVYAYLSHLSCSPRHTFFMGLSGLWSIHHRLQRYPLHGSVDDLARDLLALRPRQTPDRGGLSGGRRGASFFRSQGFHAHSSRETLGGTKGFNGGVKAGRRVLSKPKPRVRARQSINLAGNRSI